METKLLFTTHGDLHAWVRTRDGAVQLDLQVDTSPQTFMGNALSADEARELRDALSNAIAELDANGDPPAR